MLEARKKPQIPVTEVFYMVSLNSCFSCIFVKTDTTSYVLFGNVIWIVVKENPIRQILRIIQNLFYVWSFFHFKNKW